MACVRLWGLTSYNFKKMKKDPLSMINEYMYPISGVREPLSERIAIKPHLSLLPGHSAGHLVGWCQCQHSPLAPYFRPGVSQCLCLPADGGPMIENNIHKLSAIPRAPITPKWAVPRSINFKRKYKMTRYLPGSTSSTFAHVATKTSEERKREREAESARIARLKLIRPKFGRPPHSGKRPSTTPKRN